MRRVNGPSDAQAEEGTARYAALFTGLGLRPGDRVAVQVEKSAEALLLYLGCLRAGLAYLPLNSAYQEGEVAYFLENETPPPLEPAPEVDFDAFGPDDDEPAADEPAADEPKAVTPSEASREIWKATIDPKVDAIRGDSSKALVTIVEFADLQCPSCKAAAPIMDRLMKDVPSAKLIFQQFPLTQIHKWAYKAAEFGDCVARQNNAVFWKFLDNVYAHQEEISNLGANTDQEVEAKVVPKLIEYATQSGVDGKAVAACANQPATAKRIDQSMALGRKMEVTGTPTLFVNGRRVATVGSMPYDMLKKIAEFMATKAAK
jgi:protein-disulfide isomerase